MARDARTLQDALAPSDSSPDEEFQAVDAPCSLNAYRIDDSEFNEQPVWRMHSPQGVSQCYAMFNLRPLGIPGSNEINRRWADAEAYCVAVEPSDPSLQLDSHLASINTAVEHTFVENSFPRVAAWIGYHDSNRGSPGVRNWVFSDRSSLSSDFTAPWDGSEPNNGGVTLGGQSGQERAEYCVDQRNYIQGAPWHDQNCDVHYPFICEIKAKALLPKSLK